MSNQLQVLDCTLRDGGYYTSWDFSDALVSSYLKAIEAAGVNIVEIGYRSRAPKGYFGKYQVCREGHLQSLFHDRRIRCAVMIDAKDFVGRDGGVLEDELRELFPNASESVVKIVRIAAVASGLPATLQLAEILSGSGYDVSINLMRASELSAGDLRGIAKEIANSPTMYFYLADSFGGMDPREVREKYRAIRPEFPRVLGVHCHENLGFGLANTLAAVEEGADIADSTMTGIGRGAGNLQTELLLLYLRYKAGMERFEPGELVEVVASEFEPLKERHGWGTRLAYMLSGAYNLHPTYPHELLATGRYTSDEVVHTLEALQTRGAGSSYRQGDLDLALKERLGGGRTSRTPIEMVSSVQRGLPDLGPEPRVLIIGSGPSVEARADDISELIEKWDPVVLECNLHDSVKPGRRHLCCFTNQKRLARDLPALQANPRPVLTGLDFVNACDAAALEGLEVHYFPYRPEPRSFAYSEEGCTIPYDVVAVYACAVALQLGATNVAFCGFDGYVTAGVSRPPTRAEVAMEREMEEFFRMFRTEAEGRGIEVWSVTPTEYAIPVRSLYGFF